MRPSCRSLCARTACMGTAALCRLFAPAAVDAPRTYRWRNARSSHARRCRVRRSRPLLLVPPLPCRRLSHTRLTLVKQPFYDVRDGLTRVLPQRLQARPVG